MLGRKDRDQLELFMTGSIRQLVPDDHILARVDQVLNLSWLREEVADLYCAGNGWPGIDPEVAVRLMLAGLPRSASSMTAAFFARPKSTWPSAASRVTGYTRRCPITPR